MVLEIKDKRHEDDNWAAFPCEDWVFSKDDIVEFFKERRNLPLVIAQVFKNWWVMGQHPLTTHVTQQLMATQLTHDPRPIDPL